MTGLQKIAMGVVITLVDSYVAGYDVVADVLGWVLVLIGLLDLRERIDTSALVPLAIAAGVVSIALLRPAWTVDFPESTGWMLSLPQLVFSLLLCRQVAELVAPRFASDRRPDVGPPTTDTVQGATQAVARGLRLLAWGFAVAAAGPVLLYGGAVDVLLTPLAVVAVLVNVSLVYLLFRASTLVHGANRDRARRSRGDKA